VHLAAEVWRRGAAYRHLALDLPFHMSEQSANSPRACEHLVAPARRASARRGFDQKDTLAGASLFVHLDEVLRGKGVRLVRFADDFVVLGRSDGRAHEVLAMVTRTLGELGLELNPEKTRIIDFEKGFRFLGHLFVRSLTVKTDLRDDWSLPTAANDPAPAPADAWEQPIDQPAEPDHLFYDPFEALPSLLARPEAIVAAPAHDLAPVVRPLYVYGNGRRLSAHNGAFLVSEGEAQVLAAAVPLVDRIEIGPDVECADYALRLALAHEIPVVLVTAGGAATGLRAGNLPPRQVASGAGAGAARPARARDIAAALVSAHIRNAPCCFGSTGDAVTRRSLPPPAISAASRASFFWP
jgi:CRISP-associated protein Cas1